VGHWLPPAVQPGRVHCRLGRAPLRPPSALSQNTCARVHAPVRANDRYIYLLLPAYGLYLLVTKVLVPAWTAPDASDTPLDPALLKKMQRTEQRAERRARKRF
jgi:hypothetical protein